MRAGAAVARGSRLFMKGVRRRSNRREGRERGYTLAALLAVMGVIMLVITSAAPSIQLQARRELEKEAISRGEEVAEAIRVYVRYTGTLPTSMEQLEEGVPYGVKRVQILRASAARDPLTRSGRWRLIGVGHPALAEFGRAVTEYAGGRTPPTTDPAFEAYHGRINALINLVSAGVPAGPAATESSTGPFLGVASASRHESVLHYYGIERHDGWVFTPLFR